MSTAQCRPAPAPRAGHPVHVSGVDHPPVVDPVHGRAGRLGRPASSFRRSRSIKRHYAELYWVINRLRSAAVCELISIEPSLDTCTPWP